MEKIEIVFRKSVGSYRNLKIIKLRGGPAPTSRSSIDCNLISEYSNAGSVKAVHRVSALYRFLQREPGAEWTKATCATSAIFQTRRLQVPVGRHIYVIS